MKRSTHLSVDAEYVIRHRETGIEERLEVAGLETVWHWDDGSRDAAEYWAVIDWIAQTYGNDVDWFSVTCWAGSPRKDTREETKAMKLTQEAIDRIEWANSKGITVDDTPEQIAETVEAQEIVSYCTPQGTVVFDVDDIEGDA